MPGPWKKRAPAGDRRRHPPDPRTLIDAQSVTGAIVAAFAVMLLLSGFWMYFTVAFDRVFPWFTIIQGMFIGLAVRRFGRGLDWRFPLIAGAAAWIAAFFGNFMIAIPTTASTLDATAFEVLRGVTWWSVEVFFAEVISVVDYIYAFCAVAVAIFYSKRRLNRQEEFALRTRQDT